MIYSRFRSLFSGYVFPHAELDPHNPTVRYELRHDAGDKALFMVSVRWLLYTTGVMLGFWVLIAGLMLLDVDAMESFYDSIASLLGLIFLASLADKLVLDFTGVSSALTRLSDDIRGGHFEMVLLTNVSMRHVVYAKQTAAQIAAWRTMMLVIGVRLGVVVLSVLHFIILPSIVPDWALMGRNPINSSSVTFNTVDTAIAWLLMMSGIFIAAVVYVVEPRWRLRALTAAGLAVSSQGRDISLAIATTGLVVLRVWVLQIIVGLAAFMLIWFAVWISGMLFSLFESQSLTALAAPMYSLLVGMLIRSTYLGLAQRSLFRARQRLVKRGGLP